MATIALLALIAVAFASMARGAVKMEVAFPLVASAMLCLVGPAEAAGIVAGSGSEFIHVAIMFTAVAVPAKILHESGALDLLSAWVGGKIGAISNRYYYFPFWFTATAACLLCTYICAGLFHNTTSILVFGPFALLVCKNYKLPALPILSGVLVASNLGGFSTKFGDTPNIRESEIWNLTQWDFLKEIAPVNIGFLIILIVVVSLLVRRKLRARPQLTSSTGLESFEAIWRTMQFRRGLHLVDIDKRKLLIGVLGLVTAVGGSMIFPTHELLASFAAISLCVIVERSGGRERALQALSLPTYVTLFSLFCIAGVLAGSSIGVRPYLERWISSGSLVSILTASYVGTMLTEAASWVSTAATIVHIQSPTHQSAWALGAGICAGSSSVLTAATAGVLLAQVTSPREDDDFDSNLPQVSFRSYVGFGIPISLLMLVYYFVVLSLKG
jgi:Na+/H+ antiporter NhaD/arsenite permease-like protein